MNSAATCRGRSYVSSPTPPVAHFDRFIGAGRSFSRTVSVTMGFWLNVRYPLSLLDEMRTEAQSTERSHSAQLLMVWYGGKSVEYWSFW